MKKIIKCFFLFNLMVFSVIGCGEKKQPLPEGIIPKEKLVDIMVDIHLVEAAFNLKMMEGDTALKKYDDFYLTIFEKYQISKETYDNSLKHYSQYPKELDAIYDETIEKLNETQSKVANQ